MRLPSSYYNKNKAIMVQARGNYEATTTAANESVHVCSVCKNCFVKGFMYTYFC